jgi:hypothetical protein
VRIGYISRFVDEGDTLSVGWMLSQGSILYRDVFSHHFPFPYYWVAGIVRIFGNSFEAVRISVMLLQIGLFAVCMLLTRFYLVIGLTSLVWNLINQFQRGLDFFKLSLPPVDPGLCGGVITTGPWQGWGISEHLLGYTTGA